MPRRVRPMASILLAALLVACGGRGGPPAGERPTRPVAALRGTPTGESVTRSIGPPGGTVTSADGRLSLIVPAGALAADTPISIQPITNTAASGVGGAWRLGPGGRTFARPVQLVFRYTGADLAGRSAANLGVAFQDPQGVWQAVRGVTLDTSAGTLTVATDHFSDWALFESLRLDPASGRVKVGQSIALRGLVCVQQPDTGSLLTSLLPECRPIRDDDDIVLGTVAVNGVAGGNGAVGTVRRQRAVLTYTAPARKPRANPVAVSVEVEPLLAPLIGKPPKVLLVSHIRVEDDLVQVHVTGTFRAVGARMPIQVNVLADVRDRFEADLWLSLKPGGSGSYVTGIRNTSSTETNVRIAPFMAGGICGFNVHGDYEHRTLDSGSFLGATDAGHYTFQLTGTVTSPSATVSYRTDTGCAPQTYPGRTRRAATPVIPVDLSRLQQPGDAYTFRDTFTDLTVWEYHFERR